MGGPVRGALRGALRGAEQTDCKATENKRHRQRARVLWVLIVGHIAPARVPYKGNGPQGRK